MRGVCAPSHTNPVVDVTCLALMLLGISPVRVLRRGSELGGGGSLQISHVKEHNREL